ncbi:ribonuclease R [Desulfogranum mediterraneum]|uniref:ribonuclease R n=1 Tax=Desulfogranum mediterraneum TaxID=160661 RepID=UPI00048EC6BA|nr:ribonuclease R [Desulfogranum mediterraneum]
MHRSRGRKQQATAAHSPLEQQLIALLAGQPQPLALPEIQTALRLTRQDRTQLAKALEELTKGRTLKKKNKRYSLSDQDQYLKATLDQTSKGFGFATPLQGDSREKDIFIPSHEMGSAAHGDTILVAVTGRSRGRREGRVAQVLTRAVTRLCGIFNASDKGGFLSPDNQRLPYTVRISKTESKGAEDGLAVVVEITDFGGDDHGPTGRVIEILGDPWEPRVQIRMAIMAHELHDSFPAKVLDEAESLQPVERCDQGRTDLRAIEHVTIDGADARDFDDAIAVEATDQGYTLHVSIADVAHYVTPGSAIDREAYARGTSVYLPDRVLPMLPERLSNNLCSLVPREDRPAFTASLFFDHQGHRTGARFCKSLIRSRQRFTYATVHQLLYLEDPALAREYRELLPMLKQAKKLGKLLYRQRMERGSLGFNIPEATITIDKDKISSIALSERNQAHQLIEECMLAANEAVAETMAREGVPVLYRIHEDPDPTKLEEFREVCKTLGMELPRAEPSPLWFAEILARTAGTEEEYVINNLLLRTMQQARYTPQNDGHFGLAADFYLHFTSPIRRYPDLIAHRALAAFLERRPEPPRLLPEATGAGALVDAGVRLSRSERKAIEVERDVRARLAVLFMEDKVGQIFPALISGVTSFGMFVELEQCFISGAVPLTSMEDDYYLHDGKRHRLIGERTNTIHRLGDRLEVVLERVDLLSKRLTFSLAPAKGPGS